MDSCFKILVSRLINQHDWTKLARHNREHRLRTMKTSDSGMGSHVFPGDFRIVTIQVGAEN